MTFAVSLATAVTFVWLGMVLAISFLEAPLKFRAPGVTVPIGLGIGRLVFRALNIVELIFAATLMLVLLVDVLPRVLLGATVTIGVLLIQVAILRPALARRSNRVLAGEVVARSSAHYWYVSLEVAKVVALITTGALLLTL